MSPKTPLVSIIIPCRDEEKFIAQCLDSIISQDFPKDKLEILIIEGESKDRTKKIIEDYNKQYSFIKVLNNPKRITPVSLNIGVKAARGKVIMPMGAHAKYGEKYLSKCVKYLTEFKADNVGGVMRIIPPRDTLVGQAITFVLSNTFGTGDAYFKTGSEEFRWVVAGFGTCYRREVFDKIGLYNENFVRSQDMEFNLRLKRAGGKILLVPDIFTYYYPSPNLKEFSYHNFVDGIWATYPFKFIKMPFSLRHYIPLIFVSTLLGTAFLGLFFPFFLQLFLFIIVLYFLVNLYFSAKITIKERNIKLFFVLPLVFTIRHLGYGLGSIYGLLKIIIS